MKKVKLFEEFVSEVSKQMISGTSGRTITTLDNRKYELKKDVKDARIGDYINVVLPKGTIITNLPGGVFANHKDLKDKYCTGYKSERWDDKFGVGIRTMPDTLEAIEYNSKVLESIDIEEILNELHLSSAGVKDFLRAIYNSNTNIIQKLNFKNFRGLTDYIKGSDIEEFDELRDEATAAGLVLAESTVIEAVELVHVYDTKGELQGTGELVKTKGNKSLIRWDGSSEEWIDSKLVKLVESTSTLDENFPGPGETVDAKDLDHDMLDYFNRTNKVLSIDTKSKKGIKGGVGKMYNDLVFNGDDIKLKDIVRVKILEGTNSIDEAFVGPFLFSNSTSDEDLKKMYDDALSGYANWLKGFEYPKADYKKAYQEIEKLLKKRGIKVDESIVNEHSLQESKQLNEGLSKSEINQIEDYLDKYVDEDALFDMCNDFYIDDNEWHDVKNDLDKADLTEWAISCFKTNGFKLKDVKTIFESTVNEAKILSREEMKNVMVTKYGLNFVKNSEEFDGEEGGIWLGDSDSSLMPNAKSEEMFNYYHGGSKYPQGIHKDLAKFLDKCGWYGQFADPGTVFLWPR